MLLTIAKSVTTGVSEHLTMLLFHLVKSPFGLKDRDFVNQRSWYTDGEVFIIMNHSVAHKVNFIFLKQHSFFNLFLKMKKKPPIQGVQRGISHITGYVIRPRDGNSCEFIYITHSDPRGKNLTYFFLLVLIP